MMTSLVLNTVKTGRCEWEVKNNYIWDGVNKMYKINLENRRKEKMVQGCGNKQKTESRLGLGLCRYRNIITNA